ncbi:DUF6188 family protein [Streptomyces drozdowiczii]|uniref:DUF6188 family protein n=1 Tax=Streptomyces drozdowiczii TaxID=202862 RepID=UPI0035ABE594
MGPEPSRDERHQDHRGLPARAGLDSNGEVALEAPVDLSHGTARANPSVLLNPESQDVAGALALFGANVLSAVAFKSGTLCLVFDTGHHLTCSSDPSCPRLKPQGAVLVERRHDVPIHRPYRQNRD